MNVATPVRAPISEVVSRARRKLGSALAGQPADEATEAVGGRGEPHPEGLLELAAPHLQALEAEDAQADPGVDGVACAVPDVVERVRCHSPSVDGVNRDRRRDD